MDCELKLNRRRFALSLASLALFPAAAVARETNPPAEDDMLADEPFLVSFGDLAKVPEKYHLQEVAYDAGHAPGTLVIDTGNRFLYLTLEDGKAIRYGIGVGRDGFRWSGAAEIGHKAPWPRWVPPKAMVARDPFAAKWAAGMPGGPKNPLGARALYLFSNGVDTLYRIHGTHQPTSIGRAVSSGCIRMLNVDVIDLYERIDVGTKVVVLPSNEPKQEPVRKKAPQIARSRRQITRISSKPASAKRRKQALAPLNQKRNFNLKSLKTVAK